MHNISPLEGRVDALCTIRVTFRIGRYVILRCLRIFFIFIFIFSYYCCNNLGIVGSATKSRNNKLPYEWWALVLLFLNLRYVVLMWYVILNGVLACKYIFKYEMYIFRRQSFKNLYEPCFKNSLHIHFISTTTRLALTFLIWIWWSVHVGLLGLSKPLDVLEVSTLGTLTLDATSTLYLTWNMRCW